MKLNSGVDQFKLSGIEVSPPYFDKCYKSKEREIDQESIQSSTTSDSGHHI